MAMPEPSIESVEKNSIYWFQAKRKKKIRNRYYFREKWSFITNEINLNWENTKTNTTNQ